MTIFDDIYSFYCIFLDQTNALIPNFKRFRALICDFLPRVQEIHHYQEDHDCQGNPFERKTQNMKDKQTKKACMNQTDELNLHVLRGVRQVRCHQAHHELLAFLLHHPVRPDPGVQLGPGTENSNYYYYSRGLFRYSEIIFASERLTGSPLGPPSPLEPWFPGSPWK